jgi:uncharacterized protein YndB with AHSA1/START domain
MPKIDVTDEAVIDAPPMDVYKAILDEFSGVTHWWMPYNGFMLRGDIPVDREGAVFDLIVFPKSRVASSKISVKVAKIVEAKSIELEFSGDFVGTEEYTFEPMEGKTKMQIHLNAKTNRLSLSLVSPFVNLGKGHSANMQKGFKALNSYLSKK